MIKLKRAIVIRNQLSTGKIVDKSFICPGSPLFPDQGLQELYSFRVNFNFYLLEMNLLLENFARGGGHFFYDSFSSFDLGEMLRT